MARYIVSPVQYEPSMARVYDTQKQRHVKTNSGGDKFLKAIAIAKAKHLNADEIGRKKK